MKDLIRYVHGSEDSLDVDVYYVFDEMPDFNACKQFCCEDKNENRNIICVKNGYVSDCFIGTTDEVNNSLFYTYNLHKQDYPLIIEGPVKRDVYKKDIRAIRGIISTLSRTQYRSDIKKALKNGWNDRIKVLSEIDFTTIDFENLDKNHNGKDALKVIAFQFGQAIGLHEGKEFYTKSDIAGYFKELKPFLYRQDGDKTILNIYKDKYLNYLEQIIVRDNERFSTFPDGRIFDLVHEEVVRTNEIDIDER